MSRKYKFRDPEGYYFVSFATVYWVDVFTRRVYKDIVTDSIHFSIKNKGLQIHAWCIMTNHVHLITSTTGDPQENILRSIKNFTAKQLIAAIQDNPEESRKNWLLRYFAYAGSHNPKNEKYQFWQQHNHPIELVSNKWKQQKVDYIHNNPVEAGFVHLPEEYLYSSAGDYAGKLGLLPVVPLW